MFPWSPEFAWDAFHFVFFGAFYTVLAAIAGGLGVAAWRVLGAARGGRLEAMAWHADFEELPASARACRHQLTGEAPGRVCENAFDCRCCREHPALEALRPPEPARTATAGLGFALPLDRFYHRGHTWAQVQPDGTVTVGLDDVARRLVGTPESVVLPPAGSRLVAHAPAVRLRTRGAEVRLVSPVDGEVLEARGEGASFTLRVDPGGPLDVRHLLSGREAKVWALRELERLQRAFGPAGAAPALADGGEMVADVGAALPRERYDALLGEMFLEP
jgi:hypothetical protein